MLEWDEVRRRRDVKVRSHHDEPEGEPWPSGDRGEQAAYDADYLKDWSGGVVKFPQPLLVAGEDFPIFEAPEYRIYSPFQLNLAGAADALIKAVSIPDPRASFERPEDIAFAVAPTTSMEEGCFLVSGLRIDLRNSVAQGPFLTKLFSCLRTTSFQWWLDGSALPFEPVQIASFDLSKDYSYRKEGLYRGLGRVPTSWNAQSAVASRLGIELPVNIKLWQVCLEKVGTDVSDDLPISFMLDGISAFMMYEDEKCVYSLWNAMETMERYGRRMDGRETTKYGLQLLNKSCVWSQTDRTLLRKMYEDRNDVAHGNTARHLRVSPELLREYIELTIRYGTDYHNRYRGNTHTYTLGDPV